MCSPLMTYAIARPSPLIEADTMSCCALDVQRSAPGGGDNIIEGRRGLIGGVEPLDIPKAADRGGLAPP